MKSRFFSLVTILVVSIVYYACGIKSKAEIITVDPAFAKYVSGYTSTMISRTEPIKIELASPVELENGKLPDTIAATKLFSFKPNVKGKAYFTSTSTLEFMPSEMLDEQTLYTVDFNLEKIKKVEPNFSHFKFQFSTLKQTMVVKDIRIENIDDFKIEYQQVNGTIEFADVVDTNKLEKLLSAKLNNKMVAVQVKLSGNNNAVFTIDSIVRNNVNQELVITWNGEPIHAEQKGREIIAIPAIDNFTITDIKIDDEDNQNLLITCSDPLQFNQNLNGMILIDGQDNVDATIDNNSIRVHLSNILEGEKIITISKGIKNRAGYPLKNSYTDTLIFTAAKPQLRLINGGNILPNSQGLFLPFDAIAIKEVDIRIIQLFENNIHQFLQINDLDGEDQLKRVGKVVVEKSIKLNLDSNKNYNQWHRHVLDLKKYFNADMGSIYRVSIKFNKSQTTWADENASSVQQEEIVNTDENYEEDFTDEEWHGYSFDNNYDSWQNGNNSYSPDDDDYYDGMAISKNILASDIGLIYKSDGKIAHVFTTNLISSAPLSNTHIQVYNYTKQLLQTATTDAEGKCSFAIGDEPYLVIAKHEKQRGYLKVAKRKQHNLTKFDIEGIDPDATSNGFLYADRGVWRPGDSIYLTFILRSQHDNLPSNFPIRLMVEDPRGATVIDNTFTANVNGTYPLFFKTNLSSPTGSYLAKVKVGNQTFTTVLNIETVKPNRLKINYTFKDSMLTNDTNNQLVMSAKWLTGATCKKLQANVYVNKSNYVNCFPAYKNYCFTNTLLQNNENEIQLFDGNLNENGEAIIPVKFNTSNAINGIQKLNIITKVFEPTGEFSIDNTRLYYSPYKKYIGFQIDAQGNQKYLLTNKNYQFNVIALTPKGIKTSASKVRLTVFKINANYWWQENENDEASYVNKKGRIAVMDSTFSINELGTHISYQVSNYNAGKYLFVFTDLEGGHTIGKELFFDNNSWENNSTEIPEGATQLEFTSGKNQYRVGENMTFQIPNTSKGTALISIETGNKVLQTKRINTEEGNTNFNISAENTMTPTIYIHITLLRPHLKTIDKMPIRMYGILPIQIIDENTVLHPLIACANEVEPNKIFTVQVNEQKGKAMTYTLAIVDEGLLDLTHFKTPNAWETFYAKQALNIHTWDMYNEVIGAYAGSLKTKLTIGGDGSYEEEYGNKANRFKPVVQFVGPFTLNANNKATHQFVLPNYMGRVKVMLVANNTNAYGSTEKSILVQQPLMLLSTLPRALASNDELDLPITVFANNATIKDATISITCDQLISTTIAKQTIHFNAIGDEVINFKIKVANAIGIAHLKIVAQSGKETYTEDIEIEVHHPNPFIKENNNFEVNNNANYSNTLIPKGIAGSNKMWLELSSMPDLGLQDRLDYLVTYPHGCVEQTTSSALPQLYVQNLVETNDSMKKAMQKHVKYAIEKYISFQTKEGGFSYWPGQYEVNEYATCYAGNFLIEAEIKGYVIPTQLKNKWISYQQKMAQQYTGTQKHLTQAFRLYTLAKANKPAMGAMNRLREQGNLDEASKAMLACAYWFTGHQQISKSIAQGIILDNKNTNSYQETFGSSLRDHAIILEAWVLTNDTRKNKLAQEIQIQLHKNQWYSTQEVAYCLSSLCKFYEVEKNISNIIASVKINGKVQLINTTKRNQVIEIASTNSTIISIENKGTKLFAKIIQHYIPETMTTKEFANGVKLLVNYTDMENKSINPTNIIQGKDFKMNVTVVNTYSDRMLKEMVLTQLIPSGWQIQNNRMFGSSVALPEYIDYKDNGILTYFDLNANESKTFSYIMNATYTGNYYLPSITVEAMYNSSINANIKGQKITISNQENL